MGIPSYFAYIVKNHMEIIRKYDSNTIQIHNLYLDCNSIIYDVIKEGEFTKMNKNKEIIKGVYKRIKEYIETIKPQKKVFIAFDGVAPVAKLEQQRNRRYKSWYERNKREEIYGERKEKEWDTSMITPGTKFMKELNKIIKDEIKKDKGLKYIEEIIYSGSEKAGEGEHKIFEYIRQKEEEHKETNTLIYGLDADLIMLSINHLPISPNIYLYRETPHFIKTINSELEPNESYIIDIKELTERIIMEMNNEEGKRKDLLKEERNRIYDYIFLCFFLGNDFLPHFPSCNIRTNGINKLMNAYKETIGKKENLTNGKKINWKNVRKIVKKMAENEEYNIRGEHIRRDKKEKMRKEIKTQDDKYEEFNLMPSYKRKREKYINPFKSKWEERYYEILFNLEKGEKVKKEMICVNYMEGLEWTMKYYTEGCSDWGWNYKYNYAPLFSDLIKYMPVFEKEFIKENDNKPVKEITQLAYVLPKQSLYLISKPIYKKLIEKYREYYQENCDINWCYCKYFWESHVKLPKIDIEKLEELLEDK